MTKRTLALCLGVFAVMCSARSVNAHELAEASATLVVRDGGQVELRLQIPWSDVLHRRIAPGASMTELLVRMTSQPSTSFAKQLESIEEAMVRDTRLLGDDGRASEFSRWHWPRAAEVQDSLRRELMSRLAEGVNFLHASRMGATADVVVRRDRTSVRLVLAPVLGPALLTVVHPREEWVRAGKPSAPVVVR